MKKLLIVINNMNIGGIQKALLELLKALTICTQYDVSLFCCKKTGEFFEKIPKKIRILEENPYAKATEQSLSECKKQGIKYFVFRFFSSLWSKCFTKGLPSRILCKLVGNIDGQYDVAISYSQPIGDHSFCNLTNEIVLNCVNAKKKITFLHCDFGSYGGNTKRNRNLYKKFDYVAAVSNSVGSRFVQLVPELANKVRTVYNFCDCEEIEQLANINPLSYNKKTIVTVARLSEEKGILRCIPIFHRLKKEGYDFEWHIVGGGILKNEIEREIIRYSLENNIFIEGEQINPFRYLKNADYFLLPSFHEAAPMVYNETFTLGVPMLTTNTLSAKELVEKRCIGFVCENNVEAIYEMLYKILDKKIELKIVGKPNNMVCMEQFNSLCENKEGG